MDPEQGFLVIHEHFPVKVHVIFFRALAGILCPKRVNIVHQFRTLHDLYFIRILLLFLFHLFHYLIGVAFLAGKNRLGIRRVFPGHINLNGHEGTVFLNDFLCLVLIAILQAFLVQVQGDAGSHLVPCALRHLKLGTAVTFPMYGRRALLPGKGIDVHLIRHHERRIKSQTEMSDDLVVVGFVLIFGYKIGGTGKRDLVNILLHLVRRHADSVIHHLNGLILRIDKHVHGRLIILRQAVFPHHIQLFQFRDGIASVGYQFPVKNVLIRIQPLFDDRENILAVN